MTIISNSPIPYRDEKRISYDEFVERVFSDEGIDNDDGFIININDMTEGVYLTTIQEPSIKYFTSNGSVPKWADPAKVENWTKPVVARPEPEVQGPVGSAAGFFMQNAAVSDTPEGDEAFASVQNLISNPGNEDEKGNARVYVFGSSKGGTGKTFTAIISTYRYAKTHPHQRVALIDFDIIDGQVGISIHRKKPTLRKYFAQWNKGYRDFRTMREFAVHASEPYPQNVDFYLAPTSNARIMNDAFWLNVIQNAIENYDVVVFDTGIDYINLRPISYVYKCADKILLITTTSIKSVNSVSTQISRLRGEIPSKDERGLDVFSAEDDIASHLNIVITQMIPNNEMNRTIYKTLSERANVVATFGIITDSVSRAEFYGEWSVFDRNTPVNKALDDIMA